ncbi:hypothetical protein PtB15_3B271 [Puccinia triticina]|nr:hypothetical protein PtB15_3B271 [Puccinia triticina]
MVSRTSFIDTHQNQQSNGTTRWQSTATQQNHQVHLDCLEENVEENDYTVYTAGDLEFKAE